MFIMIKDCNETCLFPVGICKLYTFSFFFSAGGKVLLTLILIVSTLSYLLEINMLVSIFILFLLSCVIISYHESNGIFARATVFSVIWFAQFLTYAQKNRDPQFDIAHWRIQYSVQAIAAVYTLAGIAKISAAGWQWVLAGPSFSLQILKNHSFLYADTGNIAFIHDAENIAAQLIKHQGLLTAMLSFSLIAETFCFVATLNKRVCIFWGIALLLMHIGIAVILRIGISAIAFPMVIFFINPFQGIANRISPVKQNLSPLETF